KRNPHGERDDAAVNLNPKWEWTKAHQQHVEWCAKDRNQAKSDEHPKALCLVRCQNSLKESRRSHTSNEIKLSRAREASTRPFSRKAARTKTLASASAPG